ncbi:hypothetical protein AKJ29_07440 [Aliiroseovarius crassostreae]|uniref:Uncharacterized protein n=1 Tax=Aliiroseovarius crassostreae TaxID=154981 RepID=A0A0P7HZT8_9RHOB|nr:hypothetical protein AKJ29_07440 [Aliiroseovarius crassostreae]
MPGRRGIAVLSVARLSGRRRKPAQLRPGQGGATRLQFWMPKEERHPKLWNGSLQGGGEAAASRGLHKGGGAGPEKGSTGGGREEEAPAVNQGAAGRRNSTY